MSFPAAMPSRISVDEISTIGASRISEKVSFHGLKVEAFTRINRNSEFFQDPSVVSPSADISQIVGAHDKGEAVVRFAFSQGIQSPDRVMRFRHLQLYVINLDSLCEMPSNCLNGSIIAVETRVAADPILQGVLG